MLTRSRCTFGARAPAKASQPRSVSVVVRAQKTESPLNNVVRPAVVTAIANVIMAMPAAAEAGKIFDFNLTLPIMAGEFLLLMVFLEKTWFTPVGKVLDERDAQIRDKLTAVKDNSAELNQLAAEAEGILKAARTEVNAMITSQKNAKQAELDKIYAEAKERVNKEVEASMAALEKESSAMFQKLDAQVEKISDEVLKRVLPQGVKL